MPTALYGSRKLSRSAAKLSSNALAEVIRQAGGSGD